MRLGRFFFPALVGCLLWAAPLNAQGATGTITGRVVEANTTRPLAGATVTVVGTQQRVVTGADGSYTLPGVQPGARQVSASRVGYGPAVVSVNVAAGQTATANFSLAAQAVQLEEIVATGYGTQRREAITGSVAVVQADEANVGVVTNATEMIQGRVAGVNMTLNSGEPGANAQIRIRGGTSISASNEPLYVVDGVPLNNVATEPGGIGIGGEAALPRSPLNLINPSDIASITILKDASSTAIYGSRAANGVVLITTKKGATGRPTMEYDGYVAMATPTRSLDVLNGNEYRQFVQQQVQLGNLSAERLATLGDANTDWEDALTRNALTHNHNLSFAGGASSTQYRASLNYMNQEGVVLDNGLERIQGRLNGTHQTFGDRLRLGLNLTASHLSNDYLPFENTGGFEGGVFTNMVVFNPTQPIRITDPATGQSLFFETGPGRQELRNPIALAEQVDDIANTTRTLGNVTAEFDLFEGVTAQILGGVDRAESVRKTYFPKISPVGAEFGGLARQVGRDNTTLTLQSLLTVRQQIGDAHEIDVIGGYEFSEFRLGEFGSEGRGFLTDAFGFNNLGGGSELVRPFSFRESSRLVSFFSRANYSLLDRYFITGVLRYDGSSRFGAGNKWALFPAISAAWRISEEDFMQGSPVSDLRLRVGYGLQGNPAVPPYSSLVTLEPGGNYVFGEQAVTGIAPNRNPNPNLKWEETSQFNVGLDYGFLDNLLSGSIEYYVKNTSDLLLTVAVPQPALVSTRLENIGEIRNTGVEASLDALALNRDNLTWRAGLVFAANRNEVVDLGGRTFITTGNVSGQGQSGNVAQRIMPGEPLGTFFGAQFVGVNAEGSQLFRCTEASASCVNGQTTNASAADRVILGDANPDFTLGLRSQVDWGNLDFSFLIRSEVGGEVFNNTALVYGTKSNVTQGRNFLASALDDADRIGEPAIYSSRWIEDRTFTRLQNVTLGYTLGLPGSGRNARLYVSGDNLLLITDYSGSDPEVHTEAGLASRGIEYLNYPRPRTVTAGVRVAF